MRPVLVKMSAVMAKKKEVESAASSPINFILRFPFVMKMDVAYLNFGIQRGTR
jgi:hypothetical protein